MSTQLSMNKNRTLAETIPLEMQDFLRLDENRTLLVVSDHYEDPKIQSFIARLQKLGRTRGVQKVTLQELSERSRRAVSTDIDSATIQAAVKLFSDASARRASDIHIRIRENHADVLYRVHGRLTPITQWHLAFAGSICATIYGVLSDVADSVYNPSSFQDARVAKRDFLPVGIHGIRVASGPALDGTVMILRLLYEASGTDESLKGDGRILTLGYEKSQADQIQTMMMRPSGINIVSGPTGSGKSTTLKQILELLSEKRPELNILTVEDPPEYPIKGAVQMPVTNANTEEERKRAFNSAIRAAMRMDPDVIMIGEIRDRESAKLALQAAMTGHQVWATLHTNSAFGVIIRLVELLSSPEIPDPVQLIADSTVLSGIVFQRLTQIVCPNCSRLLSEDTSAIPPDTLQRVMKVFSNDIDAIRVVGPGCPKCSHEKVIGSTVCSEVVLTNDELLRILRSENVDSAKRHWQNQLNGKPIMYHALEKIRVGKLDPSWAEGVVGPLCV